jgi:hypothetical protein
MGLCTVYGMSMQTDKLLACLPVLKKISRKGSELGYLMEDYARLLRERGKVADAQQSFCSYFNNVSKRIGYMERLGRRIFVEC